jgi:hypothetical protein
MVVEKIPEELLFSLPNLALGREWRWFGRTTRRLATVWRPITSITTRCPKVEAHLVRPRTHLVAEAAVP